MKFPLIGIIRKWFGLFICLMILIGASLPESSLAAPAKTVFRHTTLRLTPLYTEKRQICVGQKEKFSLLVENGYYAPVSGATVTAKGKTFITGANGVASWTAIAEKPGQDNFSVIATKQGYTDSSPVQVTINVVECSWILRMDYNEAFLEKTGTWVFEGSVEIDDTPFTVNDDGTLSLLTGQSSIDAKYHGNAYDTLLPMRCTPEPPLEGPYSIQFGGNYSNGMLVINLSAISVALPGTITFQCEVLGDDIHVSPWKYPTGEKLDLINLAKLTNISCPIDGCVRRFSLNRVQLWPFNTATYASGVLIIQREKK